MLETYKYETRVFLKYVGDVEYSNIISNALRVDASNKYVHKLFDMCILPLTLIKRDDYQKAYKIVNKYIKSIVTLEEYRSLIDWMYYYKNKNSRDFVENDIKVSDKAFMLVCDLLYKCLQCSRFCDIKGKKIDRFKDEIGKLGRNKEYIKIYNEFIYGIPLDISGIKDKDTTGFCKALLEDKTVDCITYNNLTTFAFISKLFPGSEKYMDSSRINVGDSIIQSTLMGRIELCSSEIIEMFRDRKYILPKGGVVMELNGLDFSRMLVLEDIVDGDLRIYCMVESNKGDYTFLINVTKGYILRTNRWDVDVINVLASLYGIDFEEVGLRYNFEKGTVEHLRRFKEFTYEVRSPYYWKYRDNRYGNGTECSNKIKLEMSKEIKIQAFKRKLPTGHKRSMEAERLAKLYCINLKDNETIVDSFSKNIKVRV